MELRQKSFPGGKVGLFRWYFAILYHERSYTTNQLRSHTFKHVSIVLETGFLGYLGLSGEFGEEKGPYRVISLSIQ
eukprot:1365813-Amorphochlora_amoeboformis.AAC.1